ncbi:MAG: hypothetical protein DMD86_18640 [Candidatus Rokuibacteriota bacterium]|nr:MAG: hypothetical protein DMD86_18640 [Candidatus Rokubacteria bacterium]
MRAGSLRVDAPPGLGRSGGLAATERIRLLKFVSVFAVGGTERQVVTMAEGLDRARFELHLACFRRSGELPTSSPFRRRSWRASRSPSPPSGTRAPISRR